MGRRNKQVRHWRMVANLLVLAAGGVLWGAFGSVALADGGYTITPAFQDADINTQPTQAVAVEIENNTPVDQSFKLSASDFGSLNESGGVAFLGATTNDLDRRYGLTSWLAIDHNVVFVPHGGSAKVVVTVQNRASLAPGGHYGAILATAITDTGQPKPVAPQVGLHAVLSSLILLTKVGGGTPQLKLVSETFSHNPGQLPMDIIQRFQNAGNIHVIPRGVTKILDPAGRVVARGILNDGSDYVLPESFRRIPVQLKPAGHAWLPGRYRVVTTYGFIGSSASQTFTQSMWYAGTLAVVAAWCILILVVIAGGWWLWRRLR